MLLTSRCNNKYTVVEHMWWFLFASVSSLVSLIKPRLQYVFFSPSYSCQKFNVGACTHVYSRTYMKNGQFPSQWGMGALLNNAPIISITMGAFG